MDTDIEKLSRKVDELHDMLTDAVLSGVFSEMPAAWRSRKTELEEAIRKSIEEVELTKSSFKSKQIMKIKEELAEVVGKKRR